MSSFHEVCQLTLTLLLFFKVSSQTLYLTDDSNIAIFPAQSGYFSTLDLTARGHYEIHGDELDKGIVSSGSPSTQAVAQRFSFTRTTPPSAAAGSPATAAEAPPRATMTRSFQRYVFLCRILL